ncbi:MAG: tetratricopeptide repeat protein [Bacteroidota bacterium]
MAARALALALLGAAVGGCAEAEPRAVSGAGGTVSVAAIEAALQACMGGDTEAGIATLDSMLARVPASVDALTTRGLCHWTLYAADSAGADAEAAHADFTAALDAAAEADDGAFATPLDRIYSHRAFVSRARGDDWSATIADLTAAIEAAPDNPVHRLDRGVAHRYAGAPEAARTDLETYLSMVDSADTARRDMVVEMLGELDAASGAPEPAATP